MMFMRYFLVTVNDKKGLFKCEKSATRGLVYTRRAIRLVGIKRRQNTHLGCG